MAKKGQKFMHYTNEEKEEILNKYLNGIPSLQLEKECGISSSTIREWKYKTNHPELITGNKKGRQKQELTKEEVMYSQAIIRLLNDKSLIVDGEITLEPMEVKILQVN